MHRKVCLCVLLIIVLCGFVVASIFGVVRGIIHDPHHRPVEGAVVTVHSATSDWSETASSNGLGEFALNNVPLGRYVVSVSAPGFSANDQEIAVSSSSTVEIHFALQVATLEQKVEVTAEGATVDPESSSSQTLLNREQIRGTPGAQQANSLAMITDYVPSATIVHSQLHIRGGHQVSWLIDGVPVPNTNIASNVGPQFDPKDVDSIEMQRGGYSAEFGDRTYGVFNVVTRSGFERNREGELVLNYGSFNSTDDQISFGSHSDRFAYYTSVSGNRSEYGLETPITEILHDGRAGLSNFTSLIFNPTSIDQLRLVSSLRGDHYQIPNDFDLEAAGIRDTEDERDAFVNFSWVRTAGHGVLITLSPFYHFNRANYEGGRSDTPLIPQQERGSHYAGGEFAVAALAKKHNVRFGMAGFGQHDNELFGLTDPATNSSLRQRVRPSGDSESLYAEDQWRALSWLTLNGGLRLSRFAGDLTETAADPRVGAAIELPKIHWVLRGFYGRYYQPPPLSTVAGPIVDLALSQGFGFLPLHGERDEQAEAGLSIPLRDWAFEWDAYQTHARNFFDHDVLGNSNIFFPLTIEHARIRGWEASLRSPQLFRRGKLHLAFAHQFVQGRGGVSGGLTDFSPPEDEFFYLDHDQRDTLSVGGELALPWRVAASANFNYGSGFLQGDGPGHLPGHSTFDLALRRSFGETWEAELTGLNLGSDRYLLDTSNTFGGTHYADPRQLSLTVRYRFHY